MLLLGEGKYWREVNTGSSGSSDSNVVSSRVSKHFLVLDMFSLIAFTAFISYEPVCSAKIIFETHKVNCDCKNKSNCTRGGLYHWRIYNEKCVDLFASLYKDAGNPKQCQRLNTKKRRICENVFVAGRY